MVRTSAKIQSPPRGTGSRRGVVAAMVAAVLLGTCGVAVSVPPEPDNPSDAELRESHRTVDRRVDEIGRLTNRLAEAEAALSELHAEAAIRMEEANKALVDLRAARREAEAADRAVRAARADSHAAERALESARADFDRFAAISYRHGGTVVGPVRAYLGAEDPAQVLEREELLSAVSGTHRDTVVRLRRARIEEANTDAAARAAAGRARQRHEQARDARADAEEAKAAAVRARRTQAAELESIEQRKRRVERRLDRARAAVHGLEGQRDRYERWRARQRESEAARPPVPERDVVSDDGNTDSGAASVEQVIARARSQLGVPYAWGGGDTTGPTRGIRDGGVADSHGDYRKIGFDCSGLMIYAFAPVDTLPHYSGYQYHAGRKVPLDAMRRGDLLFWGPDRIHHVALYLGDSMMIEAPYSGGRVRIAPVRYDGIMPYATRLIE